MFVGSVYWFTGLECNELYGCRVKIFDCNSGTIIWDSNDHHNLSIAQEVQYSDFSDYEVLSFDLYLDAEKRICLELNIEVE